MDKSKSDNYILDMYDKLISDDSKDNDIKRENANIDGDTTMGIMLKLGSESSKYFYNERMIPERYAKAHKEGRIHIHDLDFYGLTTTCVYPTTILNIGTDLSPIVIRAEDLSTLDSNIKSGTTYVNLLNIIPTYKENTELYTISTPNGTIDVTGEHIIPTLNRGEVLAKDITIGDELSYIGVDFIDNKKWFDTLDFFIGIEKELPSVIINKDNWKLGGRYRFLPRKVCLDKDFGRFLGLIASEGCIKRDTIIFTNQDMLLVNEVKSFIERVFPSIGTRIYVKYTRVSRIPTYDLILSGRCLCRFVHYLLGKEKSYIMKLHNIFFESNIEFISGYLGGYFDGDGSLKAKYSGSFATTSFDMARDISNLLQILGIGNYLTKPQQKGSVAYWRGHEPTLRNHDMWSVNIVGKHFKGMQKLYSNKINNIIFDVTNRNKNYNKVIAIYKTPYSGMIYDFTTENKHFNANGIYIHNCCQLDLTKLFKDGFYTGNGYIREPNDIRTYSALACIAIQCNQNEQYGGQAVPKFDYDMAPGVVKTFIKEICRLLDYENNLIVSLDFVKTRLKELYATEKTLLSEKVRNIIINDILSFMDTVYINPTKTKIYDKALEYTEIATLQAMEGLIHNLNTMHSRAGAQVPFSSLNYGTDTSEEGRMVTRCLLQATLNGMGNGETPIFPVQIFKVKDGVTANPEDPNYDLFKFACEVSAKRLFPNFSFLDSDFNKAFYKEGRPETEVGYMGCRTRVAANIFNPDNEVITGRGNLSFTSINLPYLALSTLNLNDFYTKLRETVNLVFDQLLERLRVQGSRKVKNYPFMMGQGIWIDSDKLGDEDTVLEVLKNGTLAVGFIGLAETLVALCGKHHGESEYAQGLGLEIIRFMRKLCDKKAKETGLNFSLIATPAEGLSSRFTKIDRERFGEIKGVTDREYYTNSFHVPVYYKINAFKKIEIEAPYHKLTNGGHISYVEMDGDPSKNIESFMQIIKASKDENIGYGAINHPVDRCPVCGYIGVIDDVCPGCGRHEGEEVCVSCLPEYRRKQLIKN